ncbi:hypothetical protein LTS18_004700 [Coniosporium uncinatum]|uniref:Uncharacterized protein n=1 Tax=Coniosporium uncinatum TaxID=93489 RepID=A0ACC3DS88_9PEZI|nr:hypothetical protein LTS18_004700 [Coniosporium uncinatum]
MNEEMICSSEAKYGGKGEAGGSGMNGKKGDNIAHIVGMSPCVPMRRAKRGDQFWTVANYNFGLHEGTMDNMGMMEEVMGNAAVLMIIDED